MSLSLTRLAILALVLHPLAALAAGADEYSERVDAEATRDVLLDIDRKDCKAAVTDLNKGVATKQPGVLLLAATMFEQGLCVKPDWDKAARFYQYAHEAGNRAALPRLISGYAEQNRDPAAALWWMTKSNYAMPAPCKSANQLSADPDAFVAALNSWPKGQLAACVYTAGVVLRISGDIEFPNSAAKQGVSGDAIMNFVPSTATITWSSAGIDRPTATRLMLAGDNETRAFNKTLLKHVHDIGERSLKQFTKPDNIDPTWVVQTTFAFRYK